MPLRDALRGVATLADAAEEALEPASTLLPERLRSIDEDHEVYCPGHMDLGNHRFHCWRRPCSVVDRC